MCPNGSPDRHRDKPGGEVVAYLPVLNEKFYFVISIQSNPAPKIVGIGTEYYNDILFQASSESLDFDELSALITLKPTGGWRKGDLKHTGNATHKYTLIRFNPYPEPDEFEDKLKKLLDYLVPTLSGRQKAGRPCGRIHSGGYDFSQWKYDAWRPSYR